MRDLRLVCAALLALLPVIVTAEEAVVVWQHWNPANGWDIRYADLDANGQPTGNGTICDWGGNDHDPAVAYDRTGTPTVVWAHDFSSVGLGYGIMFSRRVGGFWTPPYPVALDIPFWYLDPVVAFDENGNGLCVFVGDQNSWYPNGGQKRYYCSRWDGSNWSAPPELIPGIPYAYDSCRVPEIAFTAAPAVGGGLTTRYAVFIGVYRGQQVCYSIWSGSQWDAVKPFGTYPAIAKASPYQYYNTTSLPAAERVSMSAHAGLQGEEAVWESYNPPSPLYQSTLAFSGWSWSAPADAPTGEVGNHSPAIACGASGNRLSVFCHTTGVVSRLRYSINWAPSLPLPSGSGSEGERPALAWLTGLTRATAVWQGSNGGYGLDVYASTWNGVVWSAPLPLVAPGLTNDDRNPDIAARSGSHTMPPQP